MREKDYGYRSTETMIGVNGHRRKGWGGLARRLGCLFAGMFLVTALSACTSAIETGASAGKAVAAVSPEAHAKFLEDAQAAQAIAIAGEDAMAERCFTHIVGYLEANPPAGNAETLAIKGVMSAYAKGRVVRRAVTGQEGVSDEFWIQCGPMLSESRAFVSDVFGDVGLNILSPF